jgi:hypothetical protein
VKRPELAVVVASEHGVRCLAGCLEALEQNAPEAEVIVATTSDDDVRSVLETRFPDVRLVLCDRSTPIPELRAAGIFETDAPYVAVIEDPCWVLDGWAEHLIAAHHRGHQIVGGPILNNPNHRIRDWAGFFCEYSGSMEPLPEGKVDDLVGMNISYSRSALAACDDLLRTGHWESWLHPRLRERGFQMWQAPGMRVDYAKAFGCRDFLSHCWHHSRAHGSARNASLGRRRFVYALGSPLIPLIVYSRITRNVARRHRNVRELALATPLILLYNIAWAAGEATGYILGDRQDGLQEP